MNASLSAALLLALLAGGWLLGRRRPRPFLRSTDTSAVAALNRVQIERLQPAAPAPAASSQRPAEASEAADPVMAAPAPALAAEVGAPLLPVQAGERRQRLRQLQAWMVSGSRDQRLRALAMAAGGSRREVLPLLRLGLRDPDPLVMAAAAAAMVRFRGRSAAAAQDPSGPIPWRGRPQPGSAATPAPRNVLRTR